MQRVAKSKSSSEQRILSEEETKKHGENAIVTSGGTASTTETDKKESKSHHSIGERLKRTMARWMMKMGRRRAIYGLAISLLVLSSAFAVLLDERDGAELEIRNPPQTSYASRSFERVERGDEMFDEKEDGYLGTSASVSARSMGSDLLTSLSGLSSSQKETRVEGRMLAHRGNMNLEAPKEDMEPLADRIVQLAEEDGKGYVERRSSDLETDYSHRSRHGSKVRKLVMNLDLRVSSAEFSIIISKIRSLVGEMDRGQIVSVSTSSQDVTDDFIDATARAETLDASRKALTILMEKADSVKDVLSIQRELNAITQQYESKKSMAMNLQKRADLSYLSIRMEENTNDDNPDHTNSDWGIFATPFILACNHIYTAGVFIYHAGVYALVWSIPCMILVFILTKLIDTDRNLFL